jgi:predicted ribosome quality control (RQC) complex YloA/Tae2 family protein
VVELTGSSANLIFAEGEDPFSARIRDRLRAPSGRDANRLAPGHDYTLPPDDKPDASTATPETLIAAARTAIDTLGIHPRALVAAWTGVSPRIAREVWFRAPAKEPEALVAAWTELLRNTRPPEGSSPAGEEYRPTVIREATRGETVLCFRPRQPEDGEIREAEDLLGALLKTHERFRGGPGQGRHSHYGKLVHQAVDRTIRALEALDAEEAEETSGVRLRQLGEALLASAHQIRKGMAEVEVPDPRTGEPVTIKLNPKLNASGNANLYFKRARKLERRDAHAATRRRELESQGKTLAALAAELEKHPEEPPAEWMQRARSSGVKLPAGTATGAEPEDRLGSSLRPRKYQLGQGWELLIGKNNRGNEVLTLEIARPGDTWMHASQAAGSHAVLRHHEKGKEPPGEILARAAAYTAFFSKARGSGKVPVTVTEKRHVRKPRKAPVGTVLVGTHRTILVGPRDPDKEIETA